MTVCTAPSGSGWEVWFTGTLANTYQAAITGNGGGLTGGTSPAVSVSTVSFRRGRGPRGAGDGPAGPGDADVHGRRGADRADDPGLHQRCGDGHVECDDGVHVQRGRDDERDGVPDGRGRSDDGVRVRGDNSGGQYARLQRPGGCDRIPEPDDRAPSSSQEETTTVNALGQPLTSTDRNGNVHTYGYDVLGRQTSDAVTTLGTGVDGGVRLISTAYDGQGNPYLVTSYNATSGGSVVNQVQRVYNGLGQMTADYQAASGAVSIGTTPVVQYAYTEMSGGCR